MARTVKKSSDISIVSQALKDDESVNGQATCEHLPGHRPYNAISYGRMSVIMCRSCYGEVVLQVHNDLFTINVKAR